MSPALADFLALLAFAATGVAAHHRALPLAEWARAAWPFLLAWVLAAPFTGTWRRRELGPLLLTWAVAVPAGVLVRFLAYAEPFTWGRLVFFLTSLAFSLPYLVFFRFLAGGFRREALP